MGGFCADVASMHDTWTRSTVTPEGLLFLARNGEFVDISDDFIRDKSKADLLAKGLACLQILWVVGQAIERKIAGYPITLLEIHTLVHVVCAVCMYILWLYKPLNVRDPTVVNAREDDKVQEYIAWLLLLCRTLTSLDTYLNWHGHLPQPSRDGDGSIPDVTYLYTKEQAEKGIKDSRIK